MPSTVEGKTNRRAVAQQPEKDGLVVETRHEVHVLPLGDSCAASPRTRARGRDRPPRAAVGSRRAVATGAHEQRGRPWSGRSWRRQTSSSACGSRPSSSEERAGRLLVDGLVRGHPVGDVQHLPPWRAESPRPGSWRRRSRSGSRTDQPSTARIGLGQRTPLLALVRRAVVRRDHPGKRGREGQDEGVLRPVEVDDIVVAYATREGACESAAGRGRRASSAPSETPGTVTTRDRCGPTRRRAGCRRP